MSIYQIRFTFVPLSAVVIVSLRSDWSVPCFTATAIEGERPFGITNAHPLKRLKRRILRKFGKWHNNNAKISQMWQTLLQKQVEQCLSWAKFVFLDLGYKPTFAAQPSWMMPELSNVISKYQPAGGIFEPWKHPRLRKKIKYTLWFKLSANVWPWPGRFKIQETELSQDSGHVPGS